jgi:hypothetical protein
MRIKLVRDRQHSPEGCTFGHLYIDDKPVCWTLEDQEREVKVYGETAIPAGKYVVVITHSPHFNRDLPLLVDVPGFDGVRIHPGNTPSDTEGCILVGDVPDVSEKFLGQSRAAFTRVYNQIFSAVCCNDNITIEIV